MPFLKVPLDFFDSEEVRQYIVLSGDWSAGLPIRVICMAGERSAKKETPDGHLAGSPEEIEVLIGWKGRKGRGIESLLQAKLIAESEGGYQINPDVWKRLGSHVLKNKHKARAAAKARHLHPIDGATSNA